MSKKSRKLRALIELLLAIAEAVADKPKKKRKAVSALTKRR